MCAHEMNHKNFRSNYNDKRNQMLDSLYDLPFQRLIRREEITWGNDEDFVNEAILKAYKKAVYTRKGYYDNPWEKQYLIDVIRQIKETNLYKFLEKMPKGAILHLHPSSMGDYQALVKTAAEQTWDGKTYWVNMEEKKIVFQADPPDNTYISLKDACSQPKLHQQLMSWFILTADQLKQNIDPWVYFQDKFAKVYMLLGGDNPGLYYHYFYNAFSFLLTTDNIMHIELRTSWRVENERQEASKEAIILKALQAANRDYSGKINLTMKAIWSDSRTFARGRKKNIVDDIVYVGSQVKNPNNHHLIGYDLVSEEDSGEPTYYFLDDIAAAYSRLEGHLPRFFFHDGESSLPPDYEPHNQNGNRCPRNVYFNNNLIDAYLLNTPPLQDQVGRVGHGIELFKTPKLLEDYCELGLPVELCPVSNQLLKYMKDLRHHPGQTYLAAGLPVSLSPDDPAIYTYQGVTIDFWEACIAWDLDLKMLKVLAYYSLKYSGLSPREKEAAIAKWQDSWNDFIKHQITETIP